MTAEVLPPHNSIVLAIDGFPSSEVFRRGSRGAAFRPHSGQGGNSQPPLSQQTQQLEEELRAQLFLRSMRHVELTHAGEIFLEHARKLISNADGAVGAVRRASQGEIGWLRLGYVTTAEIDLVPHLLEEYHRFEAASTHGGKVCVR